jgi:serine O-acetyltransferase
VLGKLRALLFPGFFGPKTTADASGESFLGCIIGSESEEITYALRKQIARALSQRVKNVPATEEEAWKEADSILENFFAALPKVRALLATDLDAFFDGDPAAYNKEEIIVSYPGYYAITVNRIAHELYLLDVPLIPRVMTEEAHSRTGIDIHPGATIGHHFFIDHGTGIVIGQTTVIGNYVKIYQGVTLGALSTREGQALRDIKRHPTIQDRVTIYAGASILGGETVVGEGVTVGSNAFVTQSVAPATRVSVIDGATKFKSMLDGIQCGSCAMKKNKTWKADMVSSEESI